MQIDLTIETKFAKIVDISILHNNDFNRPDDGVIPIEIIAVSRDYFAITRTSSASDRPVIMLIDKCYGMVVSKDLTYDGHDYTITIDGENYSNPFNYGWIVTQAAFNPNNQEELIINTISDEGSLPYDLYDTKIRLFVSSKIKEQYLPSS